MRTDHSRYYFKLIEKIKSSGLTVKEFCTQHSLNNKTYYYWKKKYELHTGKSFLPVAIDARPQRDAAGITIHYAEGTRLVFESTTDTSLLKEFIPAFCK